MLKRICEDFENDPQDDYHYLRDKEVVSIRKRGREEIFRKHRHHQPILSYEEVLSSDEDQDDEPKSAKAVILDTLYETQILELINKNASEKDLQNLLECIQSEELFSILEGVIGIRKLLTTKYPPTMQIIDLGIHKKLIELTQHNSPQVRFQAWWSLANVACGDNGECGKLIQKGALNSFFRCLEENDKRLVEQGVWGIGNIACDHADHRDRALKEGAIHELTSVIYRFQDLKLTEIVCWVISSLCRSKPLPPYQIVEEGILTMCCMISTGCIKNEQYLLECLVAINKHCKAHRRSQNELKSIFQTEFIINLIAYTAHHNLHIVKQALEIIGNLLTGDQEVINFFLKLNILQYLMQCLRHKNSDIRSTACWALSNVAQSNQQHVTIFLSHKKLIDILLDLMICDENWVRIEIIVIFANLGDNCCCEFDVEEFYVEIELMDIIIELLKDEDKSIVEQALKYLFNIFQRADERDHLQKVIQSFNKYNGLVMLHHIRFQLKGQAQYENQKIISRFFSEQEINQICV